MRGAGASSPGRGEPAAAGRPAAERIALLALVAEHLVPGAGDTAFDADTLDATEAAVLDALAAAVAGHDPAAHAATDALAADGRPIAAAVAALDPAERDALALAITAAYYARPDVRERIGYPGPAEIPLPSLPDPADAELEPLLERVRARGPIYRDTSPSSSTTCSHQRSSSARATSSSDRPSQP